MSIKAKSMLVVGTDVYLRGWREGLLAWFSDVHLTCKFVGTLPGLFMSAGGSAQHGKHQTLGTSPPPGLVLYALGWSTAGFLECSLWPACGPVLGALLSG